MRLTAALLDVDTTMRALVAGADGWTVYADTRTKRPSHTPSLLAIHTPTAQLVAIYVRPRKLHPSERPATNRLPANLDAAVWWPAIRDDISRWLAHPDGPPPGHLDRTAP